MKLSAPLAFALDTLDAAQQHRAAVESASIVALAAILDFVPVSRDDAVTILEIAAGVLGEAESLAAQAISNTRDLLDEGERSADLLIAALTKAAKLASLEGAKVTERLVLNVLGAWRPEVLEYRPTFD
jgi:hypothetical protein